MTATSTWSATYSLAFSMQIERCASSTAWRVTPADPASASAAALALSPACSSSTTASWAACSLAVATFDALAALAANSRTTAASTGDAPASAPTAEGGGGDLLRHVRQSAFDVVHHTPLGSPPRWHTQPSGRRSV